MNEAQAGLAPNRPKRPWYVPDIVLVVGFVLLCVSLFGVPSWIGYRHALRTGYHEFGSLLAFGGLALLLAIWVLVLGEAGRPTIRLGWGGSLAYWGFVVGDETMTVPETQPRTKEEFPSGPVYSPGEYRLPIAPGAYVWHQIR